MKILWHSNSPLVPTGYGVQTALITPLLAEHHDVAISSYYGLEGAPIMWEHGGQRIPVFPGLGGEFGNPYIQGHASAFFGGDSKDGIVMTLMDVLALSQGVYSNLNAVCWTPVDHDPATPRQRNFFQESAAIPIAMSRYGQERLEEFDALYCPHGVDTEVYKPMDPAERAEVRKLKGADEDAFIVGMVAANKGWPSRKCFPEAMMAFAKLREEHDNAVLYLHTETSGTVGQGLPLLEIAGSLGIPPEALAHCHQYELLLNPDPPEQMAATYNTFDVLLSPSAGEGFGVPIIEAQACGIPAIVTDFTAMKEVCGVGWFVPGQKEFTGQRSWQMTPNVDEIYVALEEAYALSETERKEFAAKARVHALDYDAQTVVDEHMLPALAEVEERIGDQPMVVSQR